MDNAHLLTPEELSAKLEGVGQRRGKLEALREAMQASEADRQLWEQAVRENEETRLYMMLALAITEAAAAYPCFIAWCKQREM